MTKDNYLSNDVDVYMNIYVPGCLVTLLQLQSILLHRGFYIVEWCKVRLADTQASEYDWLTPRLQSKIG